MPQLQVCFSPALLPVYKVQDSICIVTDVLRATSCMVAGLNHGITSIRPVATIYEAVMLGKQGYYTAGERNGAQAPGMQMGNSPFDFMQEELVGQKVAMTTTNGTQALAACKGAKQVIIGAMLNLNAVVNYVRQQQMDLLVVCAGWKNLPNAEDTLFAGALATALKEYDTNDDSAWMSMLLYQQFLADKKSFLDQTSHVRRLHHLDIERDIDYCFQESIYNTVPVLGADLELRG